MIRYLSGVDNSELQAVAHRYNVGLLVTPDTDRKKKYSNLAAEYPFWAADNGCFNNPSRSVESLLSWLGTLPNTGLFFPAPDVVGNAQLTLERSLPVLPQIRQLGWRAAFVAQDSIENTHIPWDEFDCLFLGGTTEFKLGPIAYALTQEAKLRDKWVHMGRVNSFKRLQLANSWGCDSADGTFLQYAGKVGVERMIKWFDKLSTCAGASINSPMPTLETGAKQPS